MDVGIRRDRRGRLVRIGEERHRLAQPAQDNVPRAGQRLYRGIDHIRDAIHRHPPPAARDPGVGALRDQPRTGGRGDTMGVLQRLGAHRVAAQDDQRGQAAAQDVGGIAHLCRVGERLRRHRQRLGNYAALVPRGIRRQDQRCDLSGMGARGLHRHSGIGAHRGRCGGGTDPRRGAARPALGIGRQRRVVRAMVGRLVAHDVDDRRLRAPGVVQVGEPVGEARAAVQQRRRRLARHARVAIGCAGHHALEQAEDAAHSRDAVECGDEVHLGGAGIAEAGFDAAVQQTVHKAFGAVHGWVLSGSRTAGTCATGGQSGNRCGVAHTGRSGHHPAAGAAGPSARKHPTRRKN